MKGSIYVLIGAISYGVLSTFVKLAYKAGYIVNDVVGVQMLLGVLVLWSIVIINKLINKTKAEDKVKHYEAFTKKDIILLMVVGSSTGLTGLFYYSALQYISASFGIVLLFQFTWIGLVIEAVFLRKLPSKAKLISLIPLLVGTIIASNILNGSFEINPIGIMYGLMAATSYSVFIIVSGKIATKCEPITKSAFMISGGAILCTIIAPPTFYSNPSLFFELALHSGIYLAFFGPIFSTIMFAKGTPLIGTGMASLLGAMELPTAIIMSQLVLKEQVSYLQYIGILLILFAIALPQLNLSSKKLANN